MIKKIKTLEKLTDQQLQEIKNQIYAEEDRREQEVSCFDGGHRQIIIEYSAKDNTVSCVCRRCEYTFGTDRELAVQLDRIKKGDLLPF